MHFSLKLKRTRSYLNAIISVVAIALLCPMKTYAQARVDLDDLAVKGEILNDNRLRMSTRESSRIQDRVKYRKNFRSEIIDGVDVRVPASESIDKPVEEVEAK